MIDAILVAFVSGVFLGAAVMFMLMAASLFIWFEWRKEGGA